MTFDDIVGRLEVALAQPLPGSAAHALMAPRPRREWPPGFNPAHARHAAGLLLLFPIGQEPHIVLTVRADTLRHGGQVSLPGGVVEPGETYPQTALREAHEEIALAADRVRILGPLTPLDIPVSGFRLHPIVAVTARRPEMRPADEEVARILEVPIGDLGDPARRSPLTIPRGTHTIQAPAFRFGDAAIWGATAMVLAEFLVLLGWNPSGDRVSQTLHS